MTWGVVSADAGIANAARARRNFSPAFGDDYIDWGIRISRAK